MLHTLHCGNGQQTNLIWEDTSVQAISNNGENFSGHSDFNTIVILWKVDVVGTCVLRVCLCWMKNASNLYFHVAKYKITNLLTDGRKIGNNTSKRVVQANLIVNCI